MLINSYLNGEIESIEELFEDRLHKGISGFMNYNRIATPTNTL